MSFEVSIIIPAYNAAIWLQPTVDHLTRALKRANIAKAEIIIVNDGSSDGTLAVARSLKSSADILVIDQENQGRFLARKNGLLKATYDNILFIDSRVYLHEGSLDFICTQLQNSPEKQVWNGHVVVAKEGNIIARFGDAITFIGWRRYFSKPRTCSYGLEDFDHFPKGTGCFFAPRKLLIDAVAEFEKQTYDIRNSSDDTHLIRIIATTDRINLSPNFSCTYHARTKIKQFIKHSFYRGQFFVDGFLRPGNRFFLPLIGFLIGSFSLIAALSVEPQLALTLALCFGALWLIELVSAILLGVIIKDALSLFLLTPLFAISYGAGIWKAVFRNIKRSKHEDK